MLLIVSVIGVGWLGKQGVETLWAHYFSHVSPALLFGIIGGSVLVSLKDMRRKGDHLRYLMPARKRDCAAPFHRPTMSETNIHSRKRERP
jgi:hypothetical protein